MEKEFCEEWEGFVPGRWSNTSVNVRDFIQKNFTPYDGDESFYPVLLKLQRNCGLRLWI